jgi:hypothetical protein
MVPGADLATPAQSVFFLKKKNNFINNFKLFCIHSYTNINVNIRLQFIVDDRNFCGTY